MAGAPVQADLHQMLKEVMGEGGETMVPYGATESLPIASFNGSEMLSETAEATANGEGYCVGYPLKGLTIKIIKCCDDPIPKWNDELLVPDGKHGEIVIKGPVVTPEYLNMPEATEKAKILDSDGKLWHRMGDIGYFDSKGRLWFCGRKTHRVITETTIFLPVCCEAIFNHHPQVYRTALVGTGKGSSRKPVLIVEPLPGKMPTSINERENFIKELKELGSGKDFTKAIDTFLFHPSFPVDIRHNAKIFREKLSVWAEKKLT
jgi:acyl-CoA synthetase (AMP-forming)/AMP-acid ligase II